MGNEVGPMRELTLERFTRRLVGSLAREVEAVVGEKEAREVVSLVGLDLGEDLERIVAHDVVSSPEGGWSPEDVGKVLVELKRRIQGEFSVESATRERIVLRNSRCPFGEDVSGRPSLCMMTSSVFGGIAARHAGYARVDVDEAIARGHRGCRVVVHLKPTSQPAHAWSNEYLGEMSGE